MTSPSEPLKAGAHNLMVCVIEDTMTKVERSVASGGHEEFVLGPRHALQHTMRTRLTSAVEALTHRRVAAFLSDSVIEPDLAAEVFVLDELLPETAHVREGQ